MKKIFTSLLLFVASLTLSAQGWPANYDGVMLQGF
jgi:alpha-amylase